MTLQDVKLLTAPLTTSATMEEQSESDSVMLKLWTEAEQRLAEQRRIETAKREEAAEQARIRFNLD